MRKRESRIVTKAMAINIIKNEGGIIRTSLAIKKGIHPETFYKLRDNKIIEPISRGVYRYSKLAPISSPDIVTVASRAPNAVICLISALSFHNITTQIPHDVSIAIGCSSRIPHLRYPPISVYKFSSKSFISGVEEHLVDGIKVKVYSPEKTLADCVKFRNKIGMEVVIEAIKLYKARKYVNVSKIIKYAKICRVEKIITPYLEITL